MQEGNMLTKIGLAALVGTIGTTAFAAPASAHEHEGGWDRGGGYARRGDRRDDRMDHWGRWEQQRRFRYWHERREDDGYRMYNPYWYR
jgi:hypothetical protein